MRSMTRNLLLAVGGIAVMLVVGAALIPDRGNGYYFLRIYQDPNDSTKFKLDGKPDPAPYQLDSFTKRIDWEFTNDTNINGLRVRIDGFACNGGPVSSTDCPLAFFGSLDCNSGEIPLKPNKGDTKLITANDNDKSCRQNDGTNLWDYQIFVRTQDGLYPTDPQLVIIRDGLTKFMDSVKGVLRSVKRFLHL